MGAHLVGPPLVEANLHSYGFMSPQCGTGAYSRFEVTGRADARLMPQECGIAATNGGPTIGSTEGPLAPCYSGFQIRNNPLRPELPFLEEC